jgi:hypothetical protein
MLRHPCIGFGSALLLLSALAAGAPAKAGDVTVTLDAGAGFVVENNASTIERLRIDEATGNISRNGALFVHTTGGSTNTFVGRGAGNLSSTGGRNSGFGWHALSSIDSGVSNAAFGEEALSSNTVGNSNSAFGENSLKFNIDGDNNSAFGQDALRNPTGASDNSAFGRASLRNTTSGVANAGFGRSSLYRNETGNWNSALGRSALFNNMSGSDNVAIGINAAINQNSGNRNIAIGANSGGNITTESDSISIGHAGLAGENGRIHIGTVGTHFKAAMAGIFGITVPAGAASVLVSSNGQLATISSSLRFKQDVHDMGEASDMLMKLRPVEFRYREDVADADEVQYGLIAEEVEEIAPELVTRDSDGQIYAVRYHLLPPLLLNEVQKQQRTIATLLARVEELEKQQ